MISTIKQFVIATTSLLVIFSPTYISAQSSPIELGEVDWLRDYQKAIELSEKNNKPVLILFQEVPGCATCTTYGKGVLSHPLIVDAIENEFVPLAIYNNADGMDRKILEKYNEPSWNNPVVRIVDHKGKDLVTRLSGQYGESALVRHMVLALGIKGNGVPMYIQLLLQEIDDRPTSTATYEMYCFWSGESHFGSKDGVIKTTPGWAGGKEVVKVVYDPSVINKSNLDKYGKKADCNLSSAKDFKEDKDLQYYLKKSKYRYLPLTDIQRTKINAALGNGQNPNQYLSPKQMEWLDGDQLSEVLYEKPLKKAWAKLNRDK